MKKFFLFLVMALFSVTAFSQGSIAQWKNYGNKTWFQDYKTYNGFGITNPTHTWHFVGEVYSSTLVTAPALSGTTSVGSPLGTFTTANITTGNIATLNATTANAATASITVSVTAPVVTATDSLGLKIKSKDGATWHLQISNGGVLTAIKE